MKKVLLVCCFLHLGISFGQQGNFNFNVVNHVFWKIENQESNKVSYLFGTIHLIDTEYFVLPKTVVKRLEKSDALVLELNNITDQKRAMNLIMLPNDERMTDILNQQEKDSLYAYTENQLKMDSTLFQNTFGKFKPIFFTQLPYITLLSRSKSYDQTFQKLAESEKISIRGLETMEQQMGYFDSLPSRTKAEMMMMVVRDTANEKSSWIEMQKLYVQQKLSELVSQRTSSKDVNSFYDEKLSKERNVDWVEKLKIDLKSDNLFIAVGAGHLPGQFGLINLLHQEGFTLTPIEISLIK